MILVSPSGRRPGAAAPSLRHCPIINIFLYYCILFFIVYDDLNVSPNCVLYQSILLLLCLNKDKILKI